MIRRTVTRNANDVSDERKTIAEIIADTVARLAGSVKSVTFHAAMFSLYAVVNFGLIAFIKPFDPFPFGLLSDLLGLEGIFLTIFVLASQNRQRARDQVRSDIEFETNINAELKIANLHEKIDRLTETHYQVFMNTQKMLGMYPGNRP
jgi:uncharacterized membrane protein